MDFIIKYRRSNLQSRRGMILLVVMAVLSFFAVMGMTFILMTGKNRDSAETAQLAAQNSKTAGNSPQELLEEGIMQVLAGPSGNATERKYSALYQCDLLGDMYGHPTDDNVDSVSASFTNNVMTPAGAQYAGRVVTIASGPYKGQSTLILNSTGSIVPFASGIGGTEAIPACTCVINKQRAFQGSEAMYDVVDLNETTTSNDFMSLRYTGGATNKNIRVGRVVVPSYYRDGLRPGLNNNTELGGTDIYAALSDGSFNTAASDNASPWDIDNDGDGDNDSVWMNLGLPPRPMPDGTLVVPMYAILVEDMDGRLNVNAHSMDNLSDQTTDTYSFLNTTTTVSNPNLANNENLNSLTMLNGQGFGPAEINMKALLDSDITSDIVTARRGTIVAADDINTNFFKYRYPDGNSNNPTEFGNIITENFDVAKHYKTFRTPLDFYGTLSGAIDQNGMFIWQKRGTVGKLGSSSYERDLGYALPKGNTVKIPNGTKCFKPFSPEELERVLRAYDDDSQKLESRLFNLVKGANDIDAVRNLITTESWDMPYCDISKLGTTTNLPEEIQAGFKMDINRPLTSYDENVEVADAERTQLAKDLYYLITTVYPGVDSKVAAQWAVNAVDFRDADSVCTHLQIGTINVWGCERPELLITETFAFHARMTEDSELGGWRSDDSNKCARPADAAATTYIDAEWYDPADCKDTQDGTIQAFCTKYGISYSNDKKQAIISLMEQVRDNGGDGIADMDQIYKPESGLFIELYNPWLPTETQEATPKGEYKNGGVVLGSDSNNKLQDCAWRIAVAGGKAGGNDGTSWAEDLREKKYQIDRVLYFGAHAAEEGKYTYKANVNAIVKPGQVAVIGPAGNTIFARYEDETGDSGREINIPLGVSNTINIDSKKIDNICSIGVVEEPTYRFSLTDIGGYSDPFDPATGKLATPRDMPYDADTERWTDLDGIGHGLGEDFEQAGYRIVYLQRLANPYKAYNAETNPYITFDQMPVDLYSFSGRQTKFADYKQLGKGAKASEAHELAHKQADVFIKSRQRGETQTVAGSTCVKFWSAEKIPGITDKSAPSTVKLSLCTSAKGRNGLYPAVKKPFYHSISQFEPRFYNRKLVSTTINTGSSTAKPSLPSYESVAPYYFPNRPFNSVVELMLVPQVSAYELTSSENAIDKPSSAELAPGVLPKYLYPEKGIDFLSESGSKILDYVRVQTPFVVTPMNLNTFSFGVSGSTATSNYRWSFREPGKININSISNPKVWAALLGAKSETEAKSIDGFACPATADTDMYDEYWGKIFTDNPGTRPRTFGDSDANFIAANYPIFKMNNTAQQCQSAANSVYFQTQLMQRLSNLTTTRSNVFAVWVTVGFFEFTGTVDNPTAGVSKYKVGKEYGLDNGSRQRYRAFYIIDRTRPVGYSPGKRMNADQTIILRRYLP